MIDKAIGSIVGPDGEPLAIQTVMFTTDEARILREYKKLLMRYALREAVFCQHCWNHHLSDGLDAFVTDQAIVWKCRCTQRVFNGPTY